MAISLTIIFIARGIPLKRALERPSLPVFYLHVPTFLVYLLITILSVTIIVSSFKVSRYSITSSLINVSASKLPKTSVW
jgi:hypothetical protein